MGNKEAVAKYRLKNKNSGRCAFCPNQASKGYVTCEACREKARFHFAIAGQSLCEIHKKKEAEYALNRKFKSPERILHSAAKSRAKMQNVPFNLLFEDIVIPKPVSNRHRVEIRQLILHHWIKLYQNLDM